MRGIRCTTSGFVLGIAGILSATQAICAEEVQTAHLTAVPFQDVHIQDGFWSPRIAVNRKATIEANLRQCEITGRIKNFAVAGKLQPGTHEGALYNDSDVYKMIEGIAYALSSERDADLEKRVDHIIDLIAAAQQPDGYLNTYYTLVEPQKRWKNIAHGHELYCSGHLIEAAVAYYQATGKRKLLDVARRLANHIATVFGPGLRQDTCGHEEIELALIKLYRATQDKRYLDQARFFLDVRGRADLRRLFGEYAQDHKPIREQMEVTGHAVRAMYLYSGMADVAAITGDAGLLKSLDHIWHDVVDRKMYLTGGIGPSAHNEGFTVPYDLPNDSAYAETCAAIGMALWNHRMFLLSGDSRYADILEKEVYNGLLSGVSLSGDRFYYVNPLGSKGNHHRVPWFDCSCCPTNIVRYVPGMGERVYAHRGNGLWTVLYMGNQTTVKLADGKVGLVQETKYPWDDEVRITVEPENSFTFDVYLRIPGWCHASPTVTVNGEAQEAVQREKGYVRLSRTWKKGDVIRLVLPMPVERVYADPHVKADVGRVALQRGPIVYCLEGVDNGGSVRDLVLPRDVALTPSYDDHLLGGVEVVRGEALEVTLAGDKRQTRRKAFQAVPYSTWDNRQPGPMMVWLPEKPELAEIPGDNSVESGGVRVNASHVNATDTLTALHDGAVPKASGAHDLPRMTWWDHRGTTEWVSYRFPQAKTVDRSAVYWFDDRGRGQCRVPAHWKLWWREGSEWKEVQLQNGSTYSAVLDRFNRVRFEPVTTRELKLEVQLQPQFSGGILKWTVNE
jgi:DUF1680 family protein